MNQHLHQVGAAPIVIVAVSLLLVRTIILFDVVHLGQFLARHVACCLPTLVVQSKIIWLCKAACSALEKAVVG